MNTLKLLVLSWRYEKQEKSLTDKKKQDHPTSRKPYKPPKLEKIDVRLDEVMNSACKIDGYFTCGSGLPTIGTS